MRLTGNRFNGPERRETAENKRRRGEKEDKKRIWSMGCMGLRKEVDKCEMNAGAVQGVAK